MKVSHILQLSQNRAAQHCLLTAESSLTNLVMHQFEKATLRLVCRSRTRTRIALWWCAVGRKMPGSFFKSFFGVLWLLLNDLLDKDRKYVESWGGCHCFNSVQEWFSEFDSSLNFIFLISLLASQGRGLGSQSQSAGDDWWAFHRQQELEGRSDASCVVTAKCSVFPHLKGWSGLRVSFMSVEGSKSCCFMLWVTLWSNKLWGKTTSMNSLLGYRSDHCYLPDFWEFQLHSCGLEKRVMNLHSEKNWVCTLLSPHVQIRSITTSQVAPGEVRWVDGFAMTPPQAELLCRLTFKSCDCSFCSYFLQTPAGWVNLPQQSLCSARVIQPRSRSSLWRFPGRWEVFAVC